MPFTSNMLEHVPPFSHLRGGSLLWSITLCSASAFLLFGYDQGVLGGLTTTPAFLNAMGNPNPTMLGLIAAIYDIGAFVGAILAACCGMFTGRRWAIVIGCVGVTIGAAVQASANGQGQMLAGRIIAGIGNGINTSTIPTWVSETAKPHRRGPLVATQLNIVIFGLFFAYWFDYGCVKNLSGNVVWRLPIALQAFFSVLTLVTIVFLPESPRWLYAQGHNEEADLVISRLRDLPVEDPIVQSTRAAILEVVHLENRDKGNNKESGLNWKHIIYDPTALKPTRRIMLGVMLQFFQVFSGISLAVYYLNILFQVNLKFSYEKGAILSGFNTFVLWLGTFPPIWGVERFGRRQVLIFGATMMAASMITFTVCVGIGTQKASYGGVAAIFSYMFFFGLSWQPVPWIYPPEIAPLRLRHVGGAASTGSEWIFAFVAGKSMPAERTLMPQKIANKPSSQSLPALQPSPLSPGSSTPSSPSAPVSPSLSSTSACRRPVASASRSSTLCSRKAPCGRLASATELSGRGDWLPAKDWTPRLPGSRGSTLRKLKGKLWQAGRRKRLWRWRSQVPVEAASEAFPWERLVLGKSLRECSGVCIYHTRQAI